MRASWPSLRAKWFGSRRPSLVSLARRGRRRKQQREVWRGAQPRGTGEGACFVSCSEGRAGTRNSQQGTCKARDKRSGRTQRAFAGNSTNSSETNPCSPPKSTGEHSRVVAATDREQRAIADAHQESSEVGVWFRSQVQAIPGCFHPRERLPNCAAENGVAVVLLCECPQTAHGYA